MHTTIYAIAESPKDPNVIWVGTDDGNRAADPRRRQDLDQRGRQRLRAAENRLGLVVDASHFDAGTAYATFDLHNFGDMRPYVYKTSDFGKTWTALIPADSPMRGYAHVVKEDLVNRDLLFLGTELGLWISLDGGKQWAQYKGGDLPNVAVRDLAIHPRDHDLVIATHGRGIWIVDDITPLRSLTPEMLGERCRVRSRRRRRPDGSSRSAAGSTATPPSKGRTPRARAVIIYYQRKRHIFGDLKIEVFDRTARSSATSPPASGAASRAPGGRCVLSRRACPPAATASGGVLRARASCPGSTRSR